MKALALAAALAITAGAQAQQNYPNHTVRFISGVTPGAASDTMARILAEKMSQSMGQPVIVENRLGAGGLVGAKYVAEQAEPDGHTIMMYASAFTVSTLLSPAVLNPKELQAVATVATIPTVLYYLCCWLMVEAPSRRFSSHRSRQAARMIPTGSNPACWKKCLSSAANSAFTITFGISSKATMRRFSRFLP